jgi:hypothetical protein
MDHDTLLGRYPSLLVSSTELTQPLDRVAFTMLTALLSPAELFHPATRVEDGHLVLTGNRARRVPLARAAAQVLGPGEGPLRSLLGIGADSRFTVADLDLMEDSSGPFAEVLACQLHAVAAQALVATASGHDDRRAVLAYAGLPVDGRLVSVGPNDLARVAAHIDQQVRGAGLRL